MFLFGVVSAVSLYKRGIDCQGVPYCGVLSLEAGRGKDVYKQPAPVVHGLWSETGAFGNSQCAGGDPNAQVALASCYTDLTFQTYEWQTHGICGGLDPTSFFNQVCALSAEPLQLMTQLRNQGVGIKQMATYFTGVHQAITGTDSLELYVCAGSDLQWKLADISEFTSVCNN
ncbi:hypothetical protein HDV06_000434 [Boothiomyces sp. JEL0866]|nr:hypothetical protein HDV06_000434 [Boothiomyces sp. JEL0866]